MPVHTRAKKGGKVKRRVRAQGGGQAQKVAELARKLGLETAEGRGGGLFFKGSGGEKLATRVGDEFVDVVSIAGGKGKRGGELLQLTDDIAEQLGLQARRGTTNLSAAGQASIQKALDKGFAVKNPGGAGFLSTAQPAGNTALIDDLVGRIGKGAKAVGGKLGSAAKGVVGGVSAFLEPLFGALQNDPEGQQLLRSTGILPSTPVQGARGGKAMSVKASRGGRSRLRKAPKKRFQEPGVAPPVPQPPDIEELFNQPGFLEFVQQLFARQQGAEGGVVHAQQGGRVERRLTVPERGPRARALVGGFSPAQERQQEQRISDISANTGTLDSIVGQLRNFNAGGSDIISQLRGFSPFSDIGQGTLDQMLQTGLPTDVSGITQAAQIRGRQEFDDAQDRIGERLANLGLTSSTARTAAVGRERGRLGERVAAAGLEAGVGAQESARQRQLAALGLDVQGGGLRGQALSSAGGLQLQRSGQRLSGQQSALGGAAQSSRLGLDASLGRAGAGNQFLSTLGSGGTRSFGGGRPVRQSGTSSRGTSGGRRITGAGATLSAPRRSNTSTRRQRVRSTTRTGQTGNRTRTGAPISSTGNAKIFGFAEGGRVEAAEGGRNSAFENFLQRFGADLFQGSRTNVIAPDAGTDRGKRAFRQRALAALGGEDLAMKLFENPSVQAGLGQRTADSFNDPRTRFGVGFEGPRNQAQNVALGVGREVGPARVRGGLGTRAKSNLGIDPTTFVSTPLDFQRAEAAGNVFPPSAEGGAPRQGFQEGGPAEPDLLQQLVQRQQQAALLGGNAPPVQGQLPAGTGPTAAPSVGAPGQARAPISPEQAQAAPGILELLSGLFGKPQQREGFQEGGPVGEEPVPQPGGVPQPSLPQELGQQVPGILDPRRQFFDEGGGTAPGEDDGTDKIPALLRSEEVVVTPDIVQALEVANPNEPNPDLIIALQELAQKPLEFDEEEGEFQAQAGGRPSFADFLASLFQGQQEGISPETTPELFGQAPLQFEAAPEQPSPFGALTPGLASTQVPTPEELVPPETFPTEQPQRAEQFPIPTPSLFRPSTFEQGVGEAGERTFTLSGGTPGAPGAAIQVEGGPATGGFGVPRGQIRPGLPQGGGTVSSPQITLPSGQPLRDTIRSQTRLEAAQNRASNISAAINADPIGGPEKQARLMNALQIANREVDSAVNEIVASENVATRRRESEARIFDAKARLNASISRTLQDETQRATANSPLAKELIEAAAQSEKFANMLNLFEQQAKFKDQGSKSVAQMDALIRKFGQELGFEFSPIGNIWTLLGASPSSFEILPTQEGLPGNPGAEDNSGQMAQAQQRLNPEVIQMMNQVGVGFEEGDFLSGIPTGN